MSCGKEFVVSIWGFEILLWGVWLLIHGWKRTSYGLKPGCRFLRFLWCKLNCWFIFGDTLETCLFCVSANECMKIELVEEWRNEKWGGLGCGTCRGRSGPCFRNLRTPLWKLSKTKSRSEFALINSPCIIFYLCLKGTWKKGQGIVRLLKHNIEKFRWKGRPIERSSGRQKRATLLRRR